MQFSHLIRESTPGKNQFNYSEYTGLGRRVFTNYVSETITLGGAIKGYNSFIGFTPSKHFGIAILCSCDKGDADMNNIGFALLGLFPFKCLG